MNPSTAQAEVLVDELVRNRVRHVVLSPGSRNAPLSFALHRAAELGLLRLHVRVDERSAGFLALGLASETRYPVGVVCTSGTAAVNLHPAVSEAAHAGAPLLVLTADRPPEVRAAGANQTIDQHQLYGSVRYFENMAVAENRPGLNAYWRTQVCRAWQAAYGDSRSGPAHLNIPFREPLVPEGDDPYWCESLAGRPGGQRWTDISESGWLPSTLESLSAARGLVLVADWGNEGASDWGERYGWPVLSECGGVGLSGTAAISTGMWLLKISEFVRRNTPEQVLCVGRPTVFRQVQALLANRDVEVLLAHGDRTNWPAPAHDVREVAETFGGSPGSADPHWLRQWQQADQKASAALHTALDLAEWPNGPAVARELVDALPRDSLLVLGSSNPTRDVALTGRLRPDVRTLRNRGVAGIDGTVSTAIGAAITHEGPSYALMGDLTFLHDSNGLLIGPNQPVPDLTIVVFNDDGGGIFSLLEQGKAEFQEVFEPVFGTPHGTDLGKLCEAHGVRHERVAGRSDLAKALHHPKGLRVVEVAATRTGVRELHDRVSNAVRTAVLS